MGIFGDDQEGGNLDGMQFVEARKSSDGTITISLTGLPGDMPGGTLGIGGYKFVRTSRSGMGTLKESATYVAEKSSNNFVKISNSCVYKNIPKSVLDSYNRSITPKAILADISNPDSVVKLKSVDSPWTDDPDGWTAQDILNDLDFGGVTLPSGMDYSINEVQVKAGTPLGSFIKSLLPIPGIVIANTAGGLIISTSGSAGGLEPPGTLCWQSGESETKQDFSNTVTGGNSSPIQITGGCTTVGVGDDSPIFGGPFNEDAEVIVHINQVGGMFGVESENVSSYSSESFISHMFSIGSSVGPGGGGGGGGSGVGPA